MIVEILFLGFCLVFAFAHINNGTNYNEDQMGIKISELPSGVAEQSAVVPATNADATETRKVTLLGIASLATKQTVGLANVDNTSDANKPVSTAVQSELNTKVSSQTTGIAGATAITNIVSISQANYDALPVKNPSTLYVIT